MLVDDATIAAWNNNKLPSDRMSTENAAILCNCQRWPLLVDPQLQVRRQFLSIVGRFREFKVKQKFDVIPVNDYYQYQIECVYYNISLYVTR